MRLVVALRSPVPDYTKSYEKDWGFCGSIRGIQIHYISKSEASLAAKSENAYLVGPAPSSADQREAAFPDMSSPGVALGTL